MAAMHMDHLNRAVQAAGYALGGVNADMDLSAEMARDRLAQRSWPVRALKAAMGRQKG